MPGRKYLYTERAHYMSPNMHFGIMAEIGLKIHSTGKNLSKTRHTVVLFTLAR
jgi:hypothetical protein